MALIVVIEQDLEGMGNFAKFTDLLSITNYHIKI